VPWGPNCGGMDGRCYIAPGEPVEVPKALQHWYDGKTSVTLPDGRTITPGNHRFLYWNPDRFTVPVVQFPNGTYHADEYYSVYSSMYINGYRTPSFHNVNLTVTRQFRIVERIRLDLMAEATNLFNKTNIMPNAVSGSYSAVVTPVSSTNTQIGRNSSVNSGSLSASFFEPRQITLSLKLRF